MARGNVFVSEHGQLEHSSRSLDFLSHESSSVEFSNTVNAKTKEGIYDIYIMNRDNRNTLYNFCTKVQEVADFNAAMSAAAKSVSHWALAFWIQENLLQRRPSGKAVKNHEKCFTFNLFILFNLFKSRLWSCHPNCSHPFVQASSQRGHCE